MVSLRGSGWSFATSSAISLPGGQRRRVVSLRLWRFLRPPADYGVVAGSSSSRGLCDSPSLVLSRRAGAKQGFARASTDSLLLPVQPNPSTTSVPQAEGTSATVTRLVHKDDRPRTFVMGARRSGKTGHGVCKSDGRYTIRSASLSTTARTRRSSMSLLRHPVLR